MDANEVLAAAASELAAGRRIALCVIVATRGSVPQPAGTMVCVCDSFQMAGTIGGGCVEAEIRNRAFARISRSAVEGPVACPDTAGELMTLRLDHDFGFDDGMICGGEIDVAVCVWHGAEAANFVQNACRGVREGKGAILPMRVASPAGPVEYRVRVESPPELILAGGGHIARMVAQFALPVGFAVTVIDDRKEFANEERFPQPMRTRVGDIGKSLSALPIGYNTYIVIVTRGHRHDERALAAVISSNAKYIGMIGSRGKIQLIFDDLRRAGVAEEHLERVRAPIGIGIGAVTADEIALSIAAELVSVRRKERPQGIEGPFAVSGGPPWR